VGWWGAGSAANTEAHKGRAKRARSVYHFFIA
jgi:hypothetical protein